MSSISAHYSKEIDTLRKQLNEARDSIYTHERTKMMTQENLKKAFMKGVCAMNMEAMTILNPSDQSNIERKFESLAEGAFSESTPIRQLAFNNSSGSEYKPYDSNIKEDEIFKKFGMQMSDANESEREEPSVHHTPSDKQRTHQDRYTEEKEIKPERHAYTELETASMSKMPISSSAVKINKLGNDIVIHNTKIESKDSQWKPAPAMHQDPIITNNVSQSFGYRSNLSFSENSNVPKPTLGISENPLLQSFQQMNKAHTSYNNNLDLIESLAYQPQMHPGISEVNYQSISNINQRMQVVPEFKPSENTSSNIMESLPSSGFPSVMQKNTSSVGGKTIRVNSR
jgi:hypothetical protein